MFVHAQAIQLCPTICDPMHCSPPGSSVHGFFRQEYWSGSLCSPPGDHPNPGIELASPTFPAMHQGSPSRCLLCTNCVSALDQVLGMPLWAECRDKFNADRVLFKEQRLHYRLFELWKRLVWFQICTNMYIYAVLPLTVNAIKYYLINLPDMWKKFKPHWSQ